MGFVILLHISQVVKPNLSQRCSSDSLRLLTVHSPVCWISAMSAVGSGCLVRALKETCMQWKSLMLLCASLGTGGAKRWCSSGSSGHQELPLREPVPLCSVWVVHSREEWCGKALGAADSSHTPPSTPQMCFFSHPSPNNSFPRLKHLSQAASSEIGAFYLVAEGPYSGV